MFNWLFLILSIIVLIVFACFAINLKIHRHKQKNVLNPFYFFACGVFVSAFIFFIPLLYPAFSTSKIPGLSAVLYSFHTSIRLFVVDCGFDMVDELTAVLLNDPLLYNFSFYWAAALMVISPILTAGAVLSFLSELSARIKYALRFRKHVYIFSELNERALTLANSIKSNDKKNDRVIVFTDVYKTNDELNFELVERAKEIDAILFKNSITNVNFKFHSRKKAMYFFIIGEDEIENINQISSLCEKPASGKRQIGAHYGYDYPSYDTGVYFFTTNFSSEQRLKNINTQYIKVRRVNDVQSLIYTLLDEKGIEIYKKAIPTGNTVYNIATCQNDEEKKISAIVVGLGLHGTEMLKALSWYCQMHPYRLEINAFDIQKNASEIFKSDCPELFDINLAEDDEDKNDSGAVTSDENDKQTEKKVFHNGDFETPGESHYSISIYSGYDVRSERFDKKLQKIKDATYVFVALGNDDLNIKIATKIRILFKRLNVTPVIHTIIYNQIKQNSIFERTYDIFTCGDIETNYTERCILNSDLERLALERHLQYCYKTIKEYELNNGPMSEDERKKEISKQTEVFWRSDYNYRSSIASVLHTKMKKELNMPGIKKPIDSRTDEEKHFLRVLEHQRWNAYVRSEGYIWAEKRDNLAKHHPMLVRFDKLDKANQEKDDD